MLWCCYCKLRLVGNTLPNSWRKLNSQQPQTLLAVTALDRLQADRRNEAIEIINQLTE